MTTDYLRIPLARIEPDPNQPRKTFNQTELDELAVSIKAHGVVVAIKVRPHPTKNHGSYLLVAGERRWRASQLAKLEDIPAIVETLDNKQALEQQLLENSQRVDVHPLEEAEAYHALIKQHGYTMQSLITKTGRSQSHLYGRMKLTTLAAGVKKAMLDGRLAPAIGELATRIHDGKLQERFAKECLSEDDDRDRGVRDIVGAEEIHDDVDRGKRESQPLSFRAAVTLLRRRYMLRLVDATFDTADATLVAKAGACSACPKRTGNQPILPGLTGASKIADEDLCTDPGCFEVKTGARWKQAAESARNSNIEVVDGKKAKAFFDYRDELAYNAPVVALDTELPYDIARSGSRQTFGKLLGKEVANVPKIIVQDPSGAPRELLDKDAAIKKLRELGKIDDPKKTAARSRAANKTASKKAKADRAKLDEKRELGEAALTRALEQAAAGAAKDLGAKETAFWRWISRCCLAMFGYGDIDLVASRRDLKSHDALEDLVDKLRSAGEVRALVAECFLAYDGTNANESYASKDQKDRFAEGLKVCGVDWDKAMAAAKEAAKAEAKVDVVKDKAQVTKALKKGKR